MPNEPIPGGDNPITISLNKCLAFKDVIVPPKTTLREQILPENWAEVQKFYGIVLEDGPNDIAINREKGEKTCTWGTNVDSVTLETVTKTAERKPPTIVSRDLIKTSDMGLDYSDFHAEGIAPPSQAKNPFVTTHRG